MTVKETLYRRAWRLVFVASAAVYLCSACTMNLPYLCGVDGYNEANSHCTTPSWQLLAFNSLSDAAMAGVPALLAIYIGRRSLAFLLLWSLGLFYWIYVVDRTPFLFDGEHGCLTCDDVQVGMLVVSWGTFLIVVVYRSVSRFWNWSGKSGRPSHNRSP